MERFVILSIVAFSILILILYLYLVFEKTLDIIRNRIRKKYEKQVFDFVDEIAQRLEEGRLTRRETSSIKKIANHKIKRELFEERIIYYFTLYKGELIKKLTTILEECGIVDIEIQNLRSKNLYKVSLTAKRLGEFRSKKAIDALLEVLKIDSTDVKYNALLALSKIGDENAFIKAFEMLGDNILLSERSLIEIIDDFEGDKRYLYDKMFESNNPFLSSIFIKSAANFMDLYFSEKAARFLKDVNKEKRIAAIKLIGNVADERFIDDIIECLKDEEWEVRAIAAKALERFYDERAVIPLINALSDKVWFVRYNAAISLIKIPGGIDAIDLVMQGDDRFAKDIIMYALQNVTEYKEDYQQQKISELIEKYKG